MGSKKAPERNLYSETAGDLSAKADLAPKVFATESEFRPQYDLLDLKSLDTTLNGAPGQDGLLKIGMTAADSVAAMESKNLSAQREADIGDVNRLGGLSLSAAQASDPRTAKLIEDLTTDASDELGMGYDMTPAQMRLAQQSVRSRGQGTISNIGPAGDLKEAIGVSEFAQNLRNSRRANATAAVGLRQAVYGDSFNRVLARPAAASTQGYLGQAGGISRAAGPRMFGSGVNANDVFSSNQNAAAANAAAQNSANQTYAGAGIAGGAAILSALI